MEYIKPVLRTNKKIEFKKIFDFKKPSILTIINHVNQLIKDGKVNNYYHTFKSDELDINEVSYSIFNRSKSKVIVIETRLNCDVEFIINSEKNIKTYYSGLVINLSLTGEVLKTFEIIGKNTGKKCKN